MSSRTAWALGTLSLCRGRSAPHKRAAGIVPNGLALGAVADFGAQNCQYTIPKAFGIDAR